MATRLVPGVLTTALALSLAACSNTPEQQAAAPEAAAPAAAPADASHEGHTMAKVYFVEPTNGATLSSKGGLVKFRFGSDNYQIAAVPQGEITAADVRPNMGHFHLGVDQDCLPPNQEIPRGQPNWIHFGDGKNEIDMQVTPGQHKFSVQVGDDLHRTVEGLCETITVNVE
jgi:hypothetical protein